LNTPEQRFQIPTRRGSLLEADFWPVAESLFPWHNFRVARHSGASGKVLGLYELSERIGDVPLFEESHTKVIRFPRANSFGMKSSDLIDYSRRLHICFRRKWRQPSEVLRPYVWAYGMTTGQVGSSRSLSAAGTTKQLLTFFFRRDFTASAVLFWSQ